MPAVAEAVFVPADPPRTGTLALYGTTEADDHVELVRSTGTRVSRGQVPARKLSVAEALRELTDTFPAQVTDSFRAWQAAALAGIRLVARGRLRPAQSASGYATWRVGPLDQSDQSWLRELAAAMPPQAYAIPINEDTPVRIASPEALVRQFWDAIADTLVRTPAAELAVPGAFATRAPAPVEGSTDWLAEIIRSERAGARVVLRVEPPEDDDEDERQAFRGALQLRSVADPSLLVDVADLWNAPAAVLTRLGQEAETNLLLGLRRGARAWPPLGAALEAAAPTGIDLGDADLEDLLADGAEALESAGIEVLWPTELFGGGLAVKAKAVAAPASAAEPTITLSDLLQFKWQPTLDGEPLTAAEIATLAEAKRPLVRLRGRWVRMDPDVLAKLRRKRERRLTAAEALAAALTGEVEVDGENVEFVADGPVADLAAALSNAANVQRELAQPPELEATLRPYQLRGLGWLAHLTELGLGGCLADDMGLGKTLQLIALHLHLHNERPDRGPTLVICPTTLLGTWQRELAKFAPTVPTRRFHSGSRSLDDLAPNEVVLTTYGVVRRDHETLAETAWGLVVADEAQHAKNPLSRTARALRSVPAPTRVALTGTPVENRLSELWSVLDWTTPGILGSLERFRTKFAVPIERYHDKDATGRLARITRPFLLRRRKVDPGIAPELPPKTESDVIVPLTTEQATLYKAVVAETLAKIEEAQGLERRGLIFSLLTALKQICNHPAQYLKEREPLPGRSGKLAALDELLDVILSEGESVLVFSQYVELCKLLQAHLESRGIPTLFLHGGVSVKERDRMVADFQDGRAPVFLLSLKAGGVGLTLTKATHVVHYDRWWNPAVEDQATDRAYRIGQDHPVQVHRLVTENTLEDRIASLIAAKRELADAVVGSGEAWLTELSDKELADLVQLGKEL
ncbi:DEAD/DEAH box helicase [Tenggerimyces flavus]|uniref:SNF2-related protein n=1 Tax=Tenggerimyces flavus TaxID=1708749 RepID=A0ABV7YD58_9ACTN|nr:DEAD/DEAH box helicase [Tenggerimyces flavus]MBM7787067.1 superfamily II DNA or RNA helicase [Tenggerimyces flavus]